MAEEAQILVIDDEESMRDSCRQVLAKDGYKIETAEEGDLGLQKVRALKPDLALVDLKMPGISGMELLQRIQDLDPSIITVVITGYATIESAVEAMKRGAYDFLPKPFTPDELRIITKRGLEKRKLALEAEALRREKEKLRENFITMVTHELRTPLVSIQQYFEVILGGIAGELTTKQKAMLERIRERIGGLLRLINDWLDLSRIEAGRIVEKLEPLDLAPILTKVVECLHPLAEDKKIALQMDIPPSIPMIHGDGETLEEVFTNLIANGIKFNREGGTVSIKIREEDTSLAIEVSDTGIGISEENLPFIFDQFFRVKSKDTRQITGSGLGLSIAKKIVEGHSGSIRVTSELGKGSTFTVVLPKSPETKT